MATMLTSPAVANRGRKVTTPVTAPAPTSVSATPVPANITPSYLFGQYQNAYNEAKKSNEDRYNTINQGYTDRYNTALKDLEGAGTQQLADLNQKYAGSQANATQQLAASGLSGTTIAPTMQQGIQRNQQADVNRLQAGLTQQKLGLQDQLSGDQLAFQERRTDSYPDLGQYASLMTNLGAGGVGNPNATIGGAGGGGGQFSGVVGGGAPMAYSSLYGTPAHGGGGDYQAYLDNFYRLGKGRPDSSIGGITNGGMRGPATQAEFNAGYRN